MPAMTTHLVALVFDANDPVRLAHFWAGVLGREVTEDPDEPDVIVLQPSDDTGFRIEFSPTQEPKTGPNQMHFDLTSQSPEEQQATVARALELGGRHIDIGQGPGRGARGHGRPRGQRVLRHRPRGTTSWPTPGLIGALSSDGTQQVGYFWSEALGWPLVWDQDEETAIQSPHGGSKISWGGPPVAPKTREEPPAPRRRATCRR